MVICIQSNSQKLICFRPLFEKKTEKEEPNGKLLVKTFAKNRQVSNFC